MKIIRDFKYFIQGFDFLRAYNSPFKAPKLRWYCGKIALGTPYFYPRKWVKFTPQDAIDKATEYVNDDKHIKKSFEEWYASFLNYRKAVPRKIGFDFVPLGWKTKYDSYRFEWSPRISFVFFKWQIAVTFVSEHADQYWESWLYYTRETDKSKSVQDRIAQCRREAPQTWTSHSDEGKVTTNYYNLILKRKWLV